MAVIPMIQPVPLNREKIRQLREAQKLTLSEAGARIGMSRQQWHDIESGRRSDPSFSTIERIARALGVGLGDLAVSDSPPPPPTDDDDRLSQEIEELARRAAGE